MFQNTRRVHTLLAGAAGLTLVLGVGAAVGALPRPLTTQSAASVVDGPAEAAAPGPAETVTGATAGTEPAANEPPTSEATTTVPTAPPSTAAAATKAAEEQAPAATDPAPIIPALPAPSGSGGPTIAARANPTSAQVQAAIQQIATRIPFFSIANEAQARQFGDAVCSAFDQGHSYSEVKNQVQQALAVLPMVTVKPADMDFAIRTAVQLFCPGYTSKLA